MKSNTPDYEKLFYEACKIKTEFWVTRYLISNAEGRWNGAEKSENHIALCDFYLSCFRIDKDEEYEVFESVHDATQELTDNLDKQIGFPLKGRPDYDTLAPKFFDIFHEIAIKTLLNINTEECGSMFGEDD